MDHDLAKTLFSDYLEGELAPEQAAELEEHLSGCADCAAELEALRGTLNTLATLRRVPPPPEFVSQVQQRIRKRSRGRFFTPEKLLTRIPFEWISFVLIILMLALYMMSMIPQVKGPAGAGDAGVDGGTRPVPTAPPGPAAEGRDAGARGQG